MRMSKGAIDGSTIFQGPKQPFLSEPQSAAVNAGLWLETEPAQVLLKDFKAIKPLNQAGRCDLSFFHNAKYLTDLTTTNAGAILAPADLKQAGTTDSCLIRVHDVHRAFVVVRSVRYLAL